MKHLWQRIFAYSLVLIVASQAAMLLLHSYSVDRDAVRRFAIENITTLAGSLEGRGPATCETIVALYNQRSNRVWVVDSDGRVLNGVPNKKLYPLDDQITTAHWSRGNINMWETSYKEAQFLVTVPVKLRHADATIYMLFRSPQKPGIWNLFLQGLVALTLIGGILAWWMSRRVSRPLRMLRTEVMDIAAGDLDKRVTVSGQDEISDVALAVNHMAANLARNIRGMRELVANVSHELRSPLARMQVSLALLEENLQRAGGKGDLDKVASKAALLQEELDHMEKLIGTTLLSSKLDLQAEQPMTNMVAFSDLCAEMSRRAAPLFTRNEQIFSTDIAPEISFLGDETLLCNLVSNLLDNAGKYTEKDGSVTLRLFSREGEARLEVENTHEPLAEEKLEHLFDPFYRAGIATGSGVGLGLSLVKKITELHGGTARAGNTDGGFCFYLSFPLERPGKTVRAAVQQAR